MKEIKEKEPHDAALIKGIAIKFVFLLMKVMATLLILAITNKLAIMAGTLDKSIMFLGGYILGQYMMKDWNEIIPKEFQKEYGPID